MEKFTKFLDKNTTFLLMIFYAVGLIGFSIPVLQPSFFRLTPFTILLSIALLFWFHQGYPLKFILLSLFIAFAGFFIEVAGVHTGIIFGEYVYGNALGFKLFDTPLMIGINWLMLVYGSYVISSRLEMHLIARSLLGAFLMTAYDMVLEPVAIHSDMWTWEGGIIPLRNYLAWFGISLFFHLLLHLFKVRLENKIASALFKIQFVFFLLLTLVIVLF